MSQSQGFLQVKACRHKALLATHDLRLSAKEMPDVNHDMLTAKAFHNQPSSGEPFLPRNTLVSGHVDRRILLLQGRGDFRLCRHEISQTKPETVSNLADSWSIAGNNIIPVWFGRSF